MLKFRAKDTPYGVTRETLQALSAELDMTETMVVHLAISRFAREVLPAYEADNGPLTPAYLSWLREKAGSRLPRGKVVSKKSLF